MTPFEQQLTRTPLREIPPEWRTRLLPPPRRPFAWAPFFRHLLWPHPLAWGGLAACWIAIFALNVSGPRGPQLYAVSPPGSPSTFENPTNLWCVWQFDRRYLLWADEPEIYLTFDPARL